jgi:hypothetical protein
LLRVRVWYGRGRGERKGGTGIIPSVDITP